MYSIKKLFIIIIILFLFSCSKNVSEENNGFIMDISNDEIVFYAIDGECKYGINAYEGVYDDICSYRNKDNYDIKQFDYVNIIVDGKGNITSINKANDLYQEEYQVKELLKDYDNININCGNYDIKIEKELSNDELKDFIDSIGDLKVYKDFFKQYGAGGIGCKLICEKDGTTTTIKDSGLTILIDNEEYGYYFNSRETLSSIILDIFK